MLKYEQTIKKVYKTVEPSTERKLTSVREERGIVTNVFLFSMKICKPATWDRR